MNRKNVDKFHLS